jgi:phosphatidylserine/phosphatidylglycerophosphate/cardiolipin synthase-like enzyme
LHENRLTKEDMGQFTANFLSVLDLMPEPSIVSLTKLLEEDPNPTHLRIKNATGLSEEKLDSALILLSDNRISSDAKIIVLKTALAIRGAARKENETVDFSWTGPVQFSVEGISTVSIIKEMLKSATKTITIVGYSITEEAKEIADLLIESIKNNVKITIVIHSDNESKNLEILKKIWTHAKRPKVYTRIPGTDDVYFKIHAKIIVIDSTELFVTSANLTWHGMSNNFEMGLRVRGKTAAKAEKLISELIESKYLQEAKW